jgi:hypothetical protein
VGELHIDSWAGRRIYHVRLLSGSKKCAMVMCEKEMLFPGGRKIAANTPARVPLSAIRNRRPVAAQPQGE